MVERSVQVEQVVTGSDRRDHSELGRPRRDACRSLAEPLADQPDAGRYPEVDADGKAGQDGDDPRGNDGLVDGFHRDGLP